jgi:predicted nucleic acid-binding protein
MKRTYLDSSVLIQAVQGVDGDKTAALLEDPEREFVAATFLKLELLPQPTFHKRKAELEFLAAYFDRVAEWREADEHLVAAALEAGAVPLTAVDAIHVAAAKALKCDEFITAEKPGKPLHKARGIKVSFLPSV